MTACSNICSIRAVVRPNYNYYESHTHTHIQGGV